MSDLQPIELQPGNLQTFAKGGILKTTSDGEIFKMVRDIQHDAIINGFRLTNCTDIYFYLIQYKKSIQ